MRNGKNWKASTSRCATSATRKTGYERLGEIWETQQAEHPDDWLLSMEIFEILDEIEEQKPLQQKIAQFLNERKAADKETPP